MRPSLFLALLLPLTAQAMQPLDDDALGQQTGQAGVTIEMSPVIATASAVRWVDGNGFSGATSSGQVVLSGFGVETTGAPIITIDAGNNGSGSLVHADLSLSGDIKLFLEKLSVAAGSTAAQAAATGKTVLVVNRADADLQDKYINIDLASPIRLSLDLGGQPSGHLVTFNQLQINEINVNGGFALLDANAAGCAACGLELSGFKVTKTTGQSYIDLSGSGMGVDATAGLKLTLGSNVKMDMETGNIRLGDLTGTGPSVGQLTMRGLDVSGMTVSVRGY